MMRGKATHLNAKPPKPARSTPARAHPPGFASAAGEVEGVGVDDDIDSKYRDVELRPREVRRVPRDIRALRTWIGWKKVWGMKAFKLLLAVALGIVVLAPSATATAQETAISFEEADGPDDACDLRVNSGGPFEVTIDGGPIVIQENGSVVPVPQGSSVHYLRQERTFGSTAIGVVDECEVFVAQESTSASEDTSSGGLGVPVIVGAGVAIVVLAGAVWKSR